MVSSVEFWKVISYYKKENPVVKIACLSCFAYPFVKHILFSIAQLIGKPITLDMATANLTRPSVARVCIEIGSLPRYCSSFFRQGHDHEHCKVLHKPPVQVFKVKQTVENNNAKKTDPPSSNRVDQPIVIEGDCEDNAAGIQPDEKELNSSTDTGGKVSHDHQEDNSVLPRQEMTGMQVKIQALLRR